MSPRTHQILRRSALAHALSTHGPSHGQPAGPPGGELLLGPSEAEEARENGPRWHHGPRWLARSLGQQLEAIQSQRGVGGLCASEPLVSARIPFISVFASGSAVDSESDEVGHGESRPGPESWG